ncbi:MAG: cytochrome P460 family protein [Cytophagales bacterium]|nr:cytochrome P460 family protein [Cytophagales bacterium]
MKISKYKNAKPFAIVALMTCYLAGTAFAQAPPVQSDAMNGISLKDPAYQNFWNKWRPIVSRYRVDVNEIRVTYANDVAMKTIEAGKTEFPKGAMFGKVAWRAEPDPLFPNSLMPSQLHRMQVMSRDAERYADTRGWGYGIFTPNGKADMGDHIPMAKACAACHDYAAGKGFVFLGEMDVNTAMLKSQQPSTATPRVLTPEEVKLVSSIHMGTGKVKVSPVVRKNVPENIRRYLPVGSPSVQRLGQEIAQFAFVGTLSEMTPLLLNAAQVAKQPAAFWSNDQKHWVMVSKDEGIEACKKPDSKDGASFRILRSSPPPRQMAMIGIQLMESFVCL